MYDPVTLDQLRALVTVVEEGSFSAAARKLQRVQSAVSTSMSALESRLGVTLWDRSTRVARLTDQGQAVLASARRVLAEVDSLRRLAAGLVTGTEASVSLCVDALFPVAALIDVCEGFSKAFPDVDLRVDTQLMSVVASRVLSGAASLGVVSPTGNASGLEREPLAAIRMVPVVAPTHPLASQKGPLGTKPLADAVQIVLSERSDSGVTDQAVLSPRTWRVSDLSTKHAMLRAGLGWGNLPEHLARHDLETGALVRIRPRAWAEDEHTLHLSAIYRTDTTFGPAHRWIVGELSKQCRREVGEEVPGAALRETERRANPRASRDRPGPRRARSP